MEKLSPNSKIAFAKELTYKAIENGCIPKVNDANKMAKNIIDFYHTILKNINDEDVAK